MPARRKKLALKAMVLAGNRDSEKPELLAAKPPSPTSESENVNPEEEEGISKLKPCKAFDENQDANKDEASLETPTFARRTIRSQSVYNCPHCSKQFYTHQIYFQHLQFHTHVKDGEVRKCEKCSFTCTKNAGMAAHAKSHIGNLLYTCDICGYTASNPIQLGRHRNQSHGEGLKQSGFTGKDLALHSGNDNFHKKLALPELVANKTANSKRLAPKKRYFLKDAPKLKPAVVISRLKSPEISPEGEPSEYESESEVDTMPILVDNEGGAGKGPRGRKRANVAARTCPFCGKVFKAEIPLMNHVRIHTGEKPFKCNICSYCCNQKGNLQLHMRSHARGRNLIKCELCSFVGTSLGRLTIHTKQEHSGIAKEHSSENSGKIVAPRPIKRSAKIVGKESRKAAKTEIPKLSNARSVELPISATHTQKCQFCPKEFPLMTQLQDHLRNHTGEDPFSCASCNFSTTQMILLRKHAKSHKIAAQIYRCKICGLTTRLPICLSNHVRDNHSPDVSKAGSPKESTPRKLLAIEWKKPEESKAEKIRLEPKAWRRGAFSSAGTIKRTKREVQCDLCAFVTTDRRSLVEHRCLHTGERPFQCKECPYSTNRHGDMSIHRKRHSLGSFPCEICSKVFLAARTLHIHLKLVHGIASTQKFLQRKSMAGPIMVRNGRITKMKSIAGRRLYVQHFKKNKLALANKAKNYNGFFAETSKEILKGSSSGASKKPKPGPPKVILVFEDEWNEMQRKNRVKYME